MNSVFFNSPSVPAFQSLHFKLSVWHLSMYSSLISSMYFITHYYC